MLKKVFCYVLITVMAALILTSCNNTNSIINDDKQTTGAEAQKTSTTEQNQKVDLNFWAYPYWNGIKGDEQDGKAEDFWNDCIKRFKEAHPEADVNITLEMLPWDGGPNKVNIAIASKTNPDVIVDGPVRFLGYASRGLLVPLDQYYTEEELADYVEGAWDSGKLPLDGKHYSVPWYTDVYCLLVNKSMFEEAGIANMLPSNEDRSWTFDEFKNVLKAFRSKNMYGFSLYAANEQDDAGTWLFPFGNGATLFNNSYDTVTFNSPEAVEAFSYLQSLVTEGLVLQAPETIKNTDNLQFFKDKKIAMCICSIYIIPSIRNDAKNGKLPTPFDVTTAMIPHGNGKQPVEFELSQGFAVFKSNDSNKEKWAVEFAKFLGNKENSEATKCIAGVPYRKSLKDMYGEDAEIKWATSVLKYSKDRGIWVKGYDEIRALFYPALQAMYTGQKTPQQAMDEFTISAQSKINK